MAKSSLLLSLSVFLLVLFNAQARLRSQQGQQCQVQNIDALEPTRRVRSEAGVIEHWDQNNEQLDCAGVSVTRVTIQPKGLHLPHYQNAPMVTYIIQGRGVHGAVIPGCPETYQSVQSQQQEFPREREQGQSQQQQSVREDQHQKVRSLYQGDIVANPVGVANWFYNDGEIPLVMVTLLDTSNNENQLDDKRRTFYLAGNPNQQQQQRQQGSQQEVSSNNIFRAFGDRVLTEVFGVSSETARRLRGENDERGSIVRVENGLHVIRPSRMREEQQRQQEEQQQQQPPNRLEESLCDMNLRTNIDNPSKADVYNPRAGRINRVNSRKLRILNSIQLNVERGVLYRNALVAPHSNMNAHSVIYVTRGNARVQIVGNYQQSIFDGQLSLGQVLVVPQNFVVVKKAGDQGFEWISFKTNDNAMTSPIAGRHSVIQAMPEEVLMNAFRISREEAQNLKYNRQEMEIFAPITQYQGRALAF